MHKDIENNRLERNVANFTVNEGRIKLTGNWTWQGIAKNLIETLDPDMPIQEIDAREIGRLDTTGAYFINELQGRLKEKQASEIDLLLSPKQGILFKLVADNSTFEKTRNGKTHQFEIAYQIGVKTSQHIKDFVSFVGFVGQIGQTLFETARAPWKVRGRLVMDVVYNSGYQAIGIVCLLSFLIGVVLAYQMGPQLATYGANIFVVNLLGVSVLREFAPLITSIIVAGRSGAAFAAQIGTMKVQEEVDALQTFGLSPIKRLVMPRIAGLMIALPLLVVLADVASILGGMLMSKAVLGLSFSEFLIQFGKTVAVKHYAIGLIKTPVFAIIIAAVACYRGLKVKGDANSIGEETTRSVVYAIFFIIITDAIFSIIFSTTGV
ncbi:MlaE family ABC transporter permease [Dongshaea marina]|uniref:MlaE family ABC transporter permease n=1 Tax=Dongshaea marina TaxID=2047966 RepID=UPI000D3ED381|nr:ABC transporter permease [Dongshaea marina]